MSFGDVRRLSIMKEMMSVYLVTKNNLLINLQNAISHRNNQSKMRTSSLLQIFNVVQMENKHAIRHIISSSVYLISETNVSDHWSRLCAFPNRW